MNSFYHFYKITAGNDTYIGKTKDINRRLKHHQFRASHPSYQDYPLYKKIRENGGWSKVRTEVLVVEELTDVGSMDREKELIQDNNCSLNKKIPGRKRFNQTYYQRNIETLREKARNRYVKVKTEYKHPKKSKEQMREIALKRIKSTKRPPTDLTIEKYDLTAEEIEEALA